MQKIHKVAVLGAGTMGAGIAGVCANAGCDVVLLDLQLSDCENAKQRLAAGRAPVVQDPSRLDHITLGTLSADLEKIADCDWICEAVVEDVAIKRDLLAKVEAVRRDGSCLTTNTSGIPLRDLYRDQPQRLQQDIAVTHFFNPPQVMRLVELVAGEHTRDAVIENLADFIGNTLGKGVVYAKDTVNFIGNRIGCFWMLSGLHHAEKARHDAQLNIETIDALMSKPVGFPPTGLYGLIDLIGLDVMYNVGKNLNANLPRDDIGRRYTAFPPSVAALYRRGQLGRKSGGGFYQLTRHADGSKTMQVFDLANDAWRATEPVTLADDEQTLQDLFAGTSAKARFVQDTLLTTLCYTADLLPSIADDLVNIDRAMRWGFGWKSGPFEMLDQLGPATVSQALEARKMPLPKMLQVLQAAGESSFYRHQGQEYLTTAGKWATVPQ